MVYNKNAHLDLLKCSQKLKNPPASRPSLSKKEFVELLAEPTLYDESEEQFRELLHYSARMSSHLHWENRAQYFELIEQFLNGPINFLDLSDKYWDINDAGEYLEAKLILLEPNVKSEGFAELIDDLILLFDRYCPNPESRTDDEFSEKTLRNLIQNTLIEMKDRYP